MHLSMKLFDMFDQTTPHTPDKIMAKLVPIRKSQSLTFSLKVKIIANNKKKMSRDSLVTDVQLISQQVMNDLLTIIKVGQQRSRMTRLIIITARRFLASKNQFQLAILEFDYLGHQIGSFSPAQHTYNYVGQIKVNHN